jgi:hypothetical protein
MCVERISHCVQNKNRFSMTQIPRHRRTHRP